MTVSKLSLYNGALLKLQETKLASLSEEREARRALDEAWDNDAVRYCLEAGQWKFAKRSMALTYSPSITPGVGYRYGFTIPEDHLRLCKVCSDEQMKTPLRDDQYVEEAGYWFADLDTLYISYVSNDAQYGMDFSLWPRRFTEYVESHLAACVALRVTGSKEDRDAAELRRDRKYLKEALAHDAMQEGTKFPKTGSWVRARTSGSNYRDGGSGGSFHG